MVTVRARFPLSQNRKALGVAVAHGCWLFGAAPLAAEEVLVVGESPNNVQIVWTVTNSTAQPISYFEAPIYGVKELDRPEGWEVKRFDRLRKGRLAFQSQDRRHDIRPRGGKMQFSCTRRLMGTLVGPRAVIVGFRSGERIEVPDVLVPVPQSLFQSYGLPVFLAALLGIFVLWKMRANRRAASRAPRPAPGPAPPPAPHG